MESKPIYRLCRISLYDKLLIVLILLVSLLSLLGLKNPSPAWKMAFVYNDGKLVEEIDLRHDGIKKISVPEGKMKLEVSNGRIRVIESSCPRKLCVHMGWIKDNKMPIVCVPNKVLIEIKGIDSQYDAIAQ